MRSNGRRRKRRTLEERPGRTRRPSVSRKLFPFPSPPTISALSGIDEPSTGESRKLVLCAHSNQSYPRSIAREDASLACFWTGLDPLTGKLDWTPSPTIIGPFLPAVHIQRHANSSLLAPLPPLAILEQRPCISHVDNQLSNGDGYPESTGAIHGTADRSATCVESRPGPNILLTFQHSFSPKLIHDHKGLFI